MFIRQNLHSDKKINRHLVRLVMRLRNQKGNVLIFVPAGTKDPNLFLNTDGQLLADMFGLPFGQNEELESVLKLKRESMCQQGINFVNTLHKR